MTLEDIFNKAQNKEKVFFFRKGNNRTKKKLKMIMIIGDKILSVDYQGKLYFNRLDYIPIDYEINPLPF